MIKMDGRATWLLIGLSTICVAVVLAMSGCVGEGIVPVFCHPTVEFKVSWTDDPCQPLVTIDATASHSDCGYVIVGYQFVVIDDGGVCYDSGRTEESVVQTYLTVGSYLFQVTIWDSNGTANTDVR